MGMEVSGAPKKGSGPRLHPTLRLKNHTGNFGIGTITTGSLGTSYVDPSGVHTAPGSEPIICSLHASYSSIVLYCLDQQQHHHNYQMWTYSRTGHDAISAMLAFHQDEIAPTGAAAHQQNQQNTTCGVSPGWDKQGGAKHGSTLPFYSRPFSLSFTPILPDQNKMCAAFSGNASGQRVPLLPIIKGSTPLESRPVEDSNRSEVTPSPPPADKEERAHPVYLDWSDKIWPIDMTDESKPGRGGPKPKFPTLLYQILEDAETDNNTDICAWLPHGRAFAIYKRKEFETKIMPKYCSKDNVKYSSFRRQLNLYGFLRLVGKYRPDKNAYYHEMFLRGRPDLFRHIIRTKVRGTRRRAAYNLESQPKLRELPPMPPLLPALPGRRSNGAEELHESELEQQDDLDRRSPERQNKTTHPTTKIAHLGYYGAAEDNHHQMPNLKEAIVEQPFIKHNNSYQKGDPPGVLSNNEPQKDPRHSMDRIDDLSLAAFLKDLFP